MISHPASRMKFLISAKSIKLTLNRKESQLAGDLKEVSFARGSLRPPRPRKRAVAQSWGCRGSMGRGVTQFLSLYFNTLLLMGNTLNYINKRMLSKHIAAVTPFKSPSSWSWGSLLMPFHLLDTAQSGDLH